MKAENWWSQSQGKVMYMGDFRKKASGLKLSRFYFEGLIKNNIWPFNWMEMDELKA